MRARTFERHGRAGREAASGTAAAEVRPPRVRRGELEHSRVAPARARAAPRLSRPKPALSKSCCPACPRTRPSSRPRPQPRWRRRDRRVRPWYVGAASSQNSPTNAARARGTQAPVIAQVTPAQPVEQVAPTMSLEELQATLAPNEQNRAAGDYALLYEPPPNEPPPMYPSLASVPPPAFASTEAQATTLPPPPPSYEDFMQRREVTVAPVEETTLSTPSPPAAAVAQEGGATAEVSTRELESLAAQANMRMRIVETPKHASSDSLKQVQCVSCGQTLQVLLEAKMVFCPSCSTVSPCDGSETAASASVAAPARTLPRRGIFNCIAKAFS